LTSCPFYITDILASFSERAVGFIKSQNRYSALAEDDIENDHKDDCCSNSVQQSQEEPPSAKKARVKFPPSPIRGTPRDTYADIPDFLVVEWVDIRDDGSFDVRYRDEHVEHVPQSDKAKLLMEPFAEMMVTTAGWRKYGLPRNSVRKKGCIPGAGDGDDSAPRGSCNDAPPDIDGKPEGGGSLDGSAASSVHPFAEDTFNCGRGVLRLRGGDPCIEPASDGAAAEDESEETSQMLPLTLLPYASSLTSPAVYSSSSSSSFTTTGNDFPAAASTATVEVPPPLLVEVPWDRAALESRRLEPAPP